MPQTQLRPSTHYRPHSPVLPALSRAVILTCHGKAAALTPLRRAGFAVEAWENFNTDQLGTFTRDVPRVGDAFQTALTKAKLAASCAGVRYGLGSEGSFALDPYMAMVPWNQEVLVWWDAQEGYSVSAMVANGNTNYAQRTVHTLAEAQSFAALHGFPAHALIVGQAGEPVFEKGIQRNNELLRHVEAALAIQGEAWLETDMRAHLNPRRMGNIRLAAEQLARKLSTHCPACAAPGFAATRHISGAVCTACNTPTLAACAEHVECPACHYGQERPLSKHVAPSQCPRCNP